MSLERVRVKFTYRCNGCGDIFEAYQLKRKKGGGKPSYPVLFRMDIHRNCCDCIAVRHERMSRPLVYLSKQELITEITALRTDKEHHLKMLDGACRELELADYSPDELVERRVIEHEQLRVTIEALHGTVAEREAEVERLERLLLEHGVKDF